MSKKTATTKPEGVSETPNSHDNRAKQRQDNFRGKQGAKSENEVKVALFDKLLHGFKNIQEAMSSMHISTSSRAIHLPISTRAIGFTVRYITRKFLRLGIRNINFHQFCCALYRIHLIMYEIKMVNARSNAAYRNAPVANAFEDLDVDTEIIRVIGQLGAGFAPLVNLISSVGVLHAFNTTYIPRHPNATSIDAVRQVEPSMVTYSNLRATVVALSVVATNRATRQWFYDHNPLPNARWSERRRRRDAEGDLVDDPNFPLLLNPDEIIPPAYAVAEIREDVSLIQDALELIGRKYPKYIHVGRIDFGGSGNYSMLVSNKQDTLRCHDLIWTQLNGAWVTDYAAVPALSGDDQLFWSIDKLSDPEFYSGVLHLLGELPQIPPTHYAMRLVETSKMDASHTFADALSNLVG